jgi:hypothetical protein
MMTEQAFESIFQTKEDTKIIQHSRKRRLTEFVFLLMFIAIGTIAIVFGAVFNEQSKFFRITLIIFGSVVFLIYLESFISIMMCKIVISPDELRFRSYFSWKKNKWSEIASIEIEKKKTRTTKGEKITKFTMLEIITTDGISTLFPLFRFRVQETELIVDLIKESYEENQGKNLSITEISRSKDAEMPKEAEKPITDEEIESQIPPKVEDFEVGEE